MQLNRLLLLSLVCMSVTPLICFEPTLIYKHLESSLGSHINGTFAKAKKVFESSSNEYMVSFWMKANFDVSSRLTPLSLSDGKQVLPFEFSLYNSDFPDKVPSNMIGSLQVNNDIYFQIKSGEWLMVVIEVLNLRSTVFYIMSLGTSATGFASRQVDIDVEFNQPFWEFFSDGKSGASLFDGVLEDVHTLEQILPSHEIKSTFFRTPTRFEFFADLSPGVSSQVVENQLRDVPKRLWKHFVSTANLTGFEDFKFSDVDTMFQDPLERFQDVRKNYSEKLTLSLQKEKTELTNLLFRQRSDSSLNSDNLRVLYRKGLALWTDFFQQFASESTLDFSQKRYFQLRDVLAAHLKYERVLDPLGAALLKLRVFNDEASFAPTAATGEAERSSKPISSDFGWILYDKCSSFTLDSASIKFSRSYTVFFAVDFFVRHSQLTGALSTGSSQTGRPNRSFPVHSRVGLLERETDSGRVHRAGSAQTQQILARIFCAQAELERVFDEVLVPGSSVLRGSRQAPADRISFIEVL